MLCDRLENIDEHLLESQNVDGLDNVTVNLDKDGRPSDNGLSNIDRPRPTNLNI